MSYWLYELLVLACFNWYCDCGGDVDSQDSVCAVQAFDNATLRLSSFAPTWAHAGIERPVFWSFSQTL